MTPAELRTTRKRLGLTQAEIAASLGLCTRTIIRYEMGQAAIPRQFELALQGYLSQE